MTARLSSTSPALTRQPIRPEPESEVTKMKPCSVLLDRREVSRYLRAKYRHAADFDTQAPTKRSCPPSVISTLLPVEDSSKTQETSQFSTQCSRDADTLVPIKKSRPPSSIIPLVENVDSIKKQEATHLLITNVNNAKLGTPISHEPSEKKKTTQLSARFSGDVDPPASSKKSCPSCPMTTLSSAKAADLSKEQVTPNPNESNNAVNNNMISLTCPVSNCTTNFYNRCSLQIHIMSFHKNLPINNLANLVDGKKEYKCPSCEIIFTKPNLFYLHLFPYKIFPTFTRYCSICDIKFNTNKEYLQHCTESHTDSAKKTNGNLNINFNNSVKFLPLHVRFAYEENHIICKGCNAELLVANFVISHINICHSQCSFCYVIPEDIEFRMHLNSHLKFLRKSRFTYCCLICLKAFYLEEDVKTHIKRNHLNSDCNEFNSFKHSFDAKTGIFFISIDTQEHCQSAINTSEIPCGCQNDKDVPATPNNEKENNDIQQKIIPMYNSEIQSKGESSKNILIALQKLCDSISNRTEIKTKLPIRQNELIAINEEETHAVQQEMCEIPDIKSEVEIEDENIMICQQEKCENSNNPSEIKIEHENIESVVNSQKENGDNPIGNIEFQYFVLDQQEMFENLSKFAFENEGNKVDNVEKTCEPLLNGKESQVIVCFICEQCSEEFINFCSMRLHYMKYHSQLELENPTSEINGTTTYKCPICLVIFMEPKLFYAHCTPYTLFPSLVSYQHSDNLVKCIICNFGAQSFLTLNSHVQKQHNVASVCCVNCSLNIPVKSYFNNHIYECRQNQLHNCCPFCSHSITSKDFVEHVINCKTNLKANFQCKNCLNYYFSEKNIKLHIMKHHNTSNLHETDKHIISDIITYELDDISSHNNEYSNTVHSSNNQTQIDLVDTEEIKIEIVDNLTDKVDDIPMHNNECSNTVDSSNNETEVDSVETEEMKIEIVDNPLEYGMENLGSDNNLTQVDFVETEEIKMEIVDGSLKYCMENCSEINSESTETGILFEPHSSNFEFNNVKSESINDNLSVKDGVSNNFIVVQDVQKDFTSNVDTAVFCEECFENIPTNTDFEKHKKIHIISNNIKNETNFITLEIKTSKAVKKFLKKTIFCKNCNFDFKLNYYLNAHINSCRIASIWCPFCVEFDKNKSESFDKHVKSHIKDLNSSYRCPECLRYFMSKHNLAFHMSMQHKLRELHFK